LGQLAYAYAIIGCHAEERKAKRYGRNEHWEPTKPLRAKHNIHMPLIVFDCKGIPATRRERIETAVEAGGRHVKEQYEGWIAADPFRGGVRADITRLQGVTGPLRHLVQSAGQKLVGKLSGAGSIG
jgi:hypothetical protein